LVWDSIHTVYFDITATVVSSSPNNVLEFHFTSRILVLFSTDTLIDFTHLEPCGPLLIDKLVELGSTEEFIIRILRIGNIIIEVKLPMLIFIVHAPLDDALITDWGR